MDWVGRGSICRRAQKAIYDPHSRAALSAPPVRTGRQGTRSRGPPSLSPARGCPELSRATLGPNMLRLQTYVHIFLVCCASAIARESHVRSLVVLDESITPDSYQIFWKSLEGKTAYRLRFMEGVLISCLSAADGHTLTLRTVRDTSIRLYEADTPAFDQIIFFAPETKCQLFDDRQILTFHES